jgi:hypothetical protein
MLEFEKAENYINEEENDFEKTSNEEQKNLNSESAAKPQNKIFEILKTKTGEGTIQSYEEHPLNFNQNKYVGQILRGLTGILGALDLAIIDIGMGILGLIKDRNIVKEEIENV